MNDLALVIVLADAGDGYAVFSTLEAADAWADAQDENCIVVYPMAIDNPELADARVQ